MEKVHVFVCVAIAACVGLVSGEMDCFECNVHLCSRNQSSLPEEQQRVHEECQKYHQIQAMTNVTARSTAMSQLNEEFSGCKPVLKSNCKACVKVDTTIIRRHRGVEETARVVSKVCAKEKPQEEEDSCEERGPRYSKSVVCVCYGDNCNHAASITYSLLTLTSLLMATLL